MTADVLSTRALNRATLARQFLLDRTRMTALAAVGHLVGMQAQAPDAPYVGLWTRLAGFDPTDLADLITGRDAVRTPLMRGTVHLVTAADCLAIRPLVQIVLERGFHLQASGRDLADLDLAEVTAAGRALIEAKPCSRVEIGRALSARWPGHRAESFGNAIGYLVPVVQVPPRGVWGSRGQATLVPVDTWLGRPLGAGMTREELVTRYLAAFGPASVKDIQAWCGLTRLNRVVEGLLPDLRGFADEAGRALYDLPDAPRPDPGTPAPPRFLPEFDNVLLSFDDRTRINPSGRPIPRWSGNGARSGALLVDGAYRANWELERGDDTVVLRIDPFGPLGDPDPIAREGELLLGFVAPAADHDIRFASPA